MSSGSQDRNPRRLGDTFAGALREVAPQTLLADLQSVWLAVAGETIAAHAEPVREREGAVTIACSGGAWAQELELMGDALLARINAELGTEQAVSLRFTADLSRHR